MAKQNLENIKHSSIVLHIVLQINESQPNEIEPAAFIISLITYLKLDIDFTRITLPGKKTNSSAVSLG